MSEVEIPPERWKAYCDAFSSQHRGWLVTLEILDRRGEEAESVDIKPGSTTRLANQLPLQGISLERSKEGMDLLIDVGRGREKLTHRVVAAKRISHSEEGGRDKGMSIDNAGGQTTRLRFSVAARPEVLDGFMEPD